MSKSETIDGADLTVGYRVRSADFIATGIVHEGFQKKAASFILH